MQECRKCHVEIYDSYIKTGMGKSFNYAIKEHSALCNSKMEVVYDSVLNLNYLPFWKNDSLIKSIFQYCQPILCEFLEI